MNATNTTFPSQEIITRIGGLETITASPSQFKGMSAKQIAEEVINNMDGSLKIDVSKAPEDERAPIREAANIEIDGQKPEITILGDNGEAGQEDQILRDISAEMLSDQEINIGREAFRAFIQTLINDPENYELLRDEWNKFVVGHSETGKVDSPYETHHFPNLGLKRRSEGEDILREQIIGFVKGIMEEFRADIAELFEGEDFLDHANEGMNTLDARLLAMGMAELSNFVRGAAYYRYRRGEKSLDGYKPRRIAADSIDEITAEYNINQ